MTIFQDIKTAVKMTGEIRRARKAGVSAIQLRPVYRVPYIPFGPAFPNTIEGCKVLNMGREVSQAVAEVFYGFPYEVQRRLEFTPEEPGGWAKRARFWQEQLKPALPPKMYHAVMMKVIGWYAHCLRARKEAVTV